MKPYHKHDGIVLYCCDCRDGLRQLANKSFDSIVTDPPYELGFMGKKWDSSGVAFDVRVWKECLRVLKPGGHLLAFGGTRTYHRLVCAIEDAGFEIRDQVDWIYGSGFPKSLDVSKAIDKAAGAKREVVGVTRSIDCVERGYTKAYSTRAENSGYGTTKRFGLGLPITAPATPEAKQWDGWGTGLKPAHEPICLARKPLEGTVAENVLRWGTGAINIDGCRIGTESRTYKPKGIRPGSGNYIGDSWKPDNEEKTIQGRWPANCLFDEPAAEMLDDQSGVLTSGKAFIGQGGRVTQGNVYGEYKDGLRVASCYADSGGASRFFYVAKASKSERGESNDHPTVKPLMLMRYLVRLVTPKHGKVLDPFAGSGTTLRACEEEGFACVGMEREEHNCEITARRLQSEVSDSASETR